TYLFLSDNEISDLAALSELKNLDLLYLGGNSLNFDSCYIYIPLIRENNPNIRIDYDSCELHNVYVDDDGPNDPAPYDSDYGDPNEDGTYEHPFDTVQEAIDLAFNGAVVVVRDGIYKENIDFMGKNITVTGIDPEESDATRPYPVLDGGYDGTVVVFANGEEPNSILEGFVITRGMGDMAGAISCIDSSPTISNCVIVGNRATNPDGGGGAVFCMNSNAVFKNCTVSGNFGGTQGAGFLIDDGNVTIMNSILWNNYTLWYNYPEVSMVSGSLPSVTYSNITGWRLNPDTGVINEPPLFAQPGYWAFSDNPELPTEPSDPNAVWIDGDYHLLSEFGRYQQGYNEWILDNVTSPCINAGNPENSVGQEIIPNGNIINMGAYGGTSQASMSNPTLEPVHFADANLRAAVERTLGITNPTPDDMLALDILSARKQGITDLSGLEYAVNLTMLSLDENPVSDISALAGLTNLTNLYFWINQISDISALSDLENLVELSLESNQISDISALAGLTNLTHLYLPDNQISDISALSGLTNLERLHLSENQISDISALSGLTNLTGLFLGNNQISDISALSGPTNLEILYLSENQISDISALSGLTNLETLNLSDNQISDISALSGLSNLEYLFLVDNQISNIPELTGLTSLWILHLENNQISDISALTELMNLSSLDLRSNPLNRDACDIHIPQIRENNPGIYLSYDPCRN
ncbi:MAG: leucine-rich repeat domain-containing protein, partial [Phycisphaerales bacterium]